MLKRFTITPQPRKSIKIPTSTIKPTSFPRMSIGTDDLKPVRNVRDKAYKQACAENISAFLGTNNYDGAATAKTLANPSNKEFQNVFKFIYSFIDSTPFAKFEDDVMHILKVLRYGYSGEITKSQVSAVTPHTWPVLLSMISWLVDLVNKSYEDVEVPPTIESEFYEFVCEGYARFMEGDENDADLEDGFVNRMADLHSKEFEEIENLKKEAETMSDELGNIKNKFVDLNKIENRKKKINEDLNMLILHEKQLESKKSKYIAAIEKAAEEIQAIESGAESLARTKNELLEQIGQQTINPDDIKGMNVEKIGLLKELEKLKPEREKYMKKLKEIECSILEKLDENENIFNEVSKCFKELALERDFYESRTLDASVVSAIESELTGKKDSLVNYEMNIATLEERISDKNAAFKDLEDLYNHASAKLQTIGAIYLEKKEISDRSIQKNRNEMDKLDNDLLKLKLENDSAFLKSEKDFSETKIKLDILTSTISHEREEITKMIWDFYHNVDFSLQTLDSLGKDVKKLVK